MKSDKKSKELLNIDDILKSEEEVNKNKGSTFEERLKTLKVK